jgi:hypothetical protein
MLGQLLPLLLVQATATIAVAEDRIVATPAVPAQIQTLGVRVSSPQGVLWQGSLRVAENQSASYSQNLSQASTELCPPGSPYDRSERSSVSFNVYMQNYGQGRDPSYRIDASWARPIKDANCGESGTRTVQINQAVMLEPGQTSVIEGDAGLRVELTLAR